MQPVQACTLALRSPHSRGNRARLTYDARVNCPGVSALPDFLTTYGATAGPLGFPMPDKVARALDALLKTLPTTDEYAYRKAVVARSPTELNPGERSDVSWISTESPDRCKDVVIARGMNDSQFA